MNSIIKFVLLNLVGSTIYAMGIHIFTAPQQIAPGGASGIAILVNYLIGVPIGLFVFLFNIPLLIGAYKYLTKKFVINALVSIVIFSFITDYVVIYFPTYKGDMLIAAVFGGILMGIGLAIVHLSGSTTGGLSIVGLLIQSKYSQFEVGKVLFVLNFCVVILSAIVFKNIEAVFYAIITIFTSSKCMDNIIYGWNNSKFLIIISDQNKEIKEAIIECTQKGVTILKGIGGYSEGEKQIIFCAAEKNQLIGIQKIVKMIDSKAFVIITDTREVIGNGFESSI